LKLFNKINLHVLKCRPSARELLLWRCILLSNALLIHTWSLSVTHTLLMSSCCILLPQPSISNYRFAHRATILLVTHTLAVLCHRSHYMRTVLNVCCCMTTYAKKLHLIKETLW